MKRAFLAGATILALAPLSAHAQETVEDPATFVRANPETASCVNWTEAAYNSGAGDRACDALIASGKYKGEDLARLLYYSSAWQRTREERIANYDRALSLRPPEALSKLIQFVKAFNCYELKDWDCARVAINAAWSRLKPNDMPVYVEIMNNAIGTAATKRMLDDTIAKSDHALVRAARSNWYEGQGDFERSAEDSVAAARFAPDNALLQNSACWTLGALLHKPKEALPFCDRAVGLAPGSAGIWDSRGAVNLAAGHYAEALKDYERGLTLEPNFGHVMYGKGIALKRLGRETEAAALLAAAEKLDGTVAAQYRSYGITPAGLSAAVRPKPFTIAPPAPAAASAAQPPKPATRVVDLIDNFNVDLPPGWNSRQAKKAVDQSKKIDTPSSLRTRVFDDLIWGYSAPEPYISPNCAIYTERPGVDFFNEDAFNLSVWMETRTTTGDSKLTIQLPPTNTAEGKSVAANPDAQIVVELWPGKPNGRPYFVRHVTVRKGSALHTVSIDRDFNYRALESGWITVRVPALNLVEQYAIRLNGSDRSKARQCFMGATAEQLISG